jgi:hypothetical protein
MRAKAKYLILALILMSQTISASSLDICTPSTLKVAVLRGRVVLAPTQLGTEPIANVAIELQKVDYGGPVVARVVTDKDGRFDFGYVKDGKYVVIVEAAPGLSSFSFPIQFKGARRPKKDEPELDITIGYGYKGCRGSFAQYGEARTN